MKRPNLNVWIVDDHPVVRQGLRQLIEKEKDLSVLGEADSVETALQALTKAGAELPAVIVLDISLKDVSGLELINSLRLRGLGCKVLVLSMYEEEAVVFKAMRAGAHGYLSKQEAAETIVEAIRKVGRGGFYLSERLTSRLIPHLLTSEPGTSPVYALSNREFEIYHMIGQGLSKRDIALKLNLSLKTVETHCDHLKTKLRLKNTLALYQSAKSWILTMGSSSI
ncbi:MAG: response regulator transcription factor [candidate division FCPU426 bacterium]